MNQTHERPKKRLRRWLIIALVPVLLSLYTWWLWPRAGQRMAVPLPQRSTQPDPRIIGRWAMRDHYGQLLSVWEYREDVIHVEGETYVILSSTKDTLVVREGRPREDVEPFTIKLTRLAE
jgi:hypothetical protein